MPKLSFLESIDSLDSMIWFRLEAGVLFFGSAFCSEEDNILFKSGIFGEFIN